MFHFSAQKSECISDTQSGVQILPLKKSVFSIKNIKVVPVPEDFKGIKHDTSEVAIVLIIVFICLKSIVFLLQ